MIPPTRTSEPTTLPDGEPVITEEDSVLLPLTVSSLSGEDDGASPWAELPFRVPTSDHGDPTRKVPTPTA